MSKRLFCSRASCLMLSLLASTSSGGSLATVRPVAIFPHGGIPPVWNACMSNGDFYEGQGSSDTQCAQGSVVWSFVCNVYTASGQAPTNVPLVGFQCDCTGNCLAINAVGDFFTGRDNGCVYEFAGNLFQMAGRPSNQVAMIAGNRACASYMYFVTVDGEMYTFDGKCALSWLGSVPSTPTPTRPHSWGQLKTTYR